MKKLLSDQDAIDFIADSIDAVRKCKAGEEPTRVVYYSREMYHYPRGSSRQRRKAHRHNDRIAKEFFKRFEGKKFERPTIKSAFQ